MSDNPTTRSVYNYLLQQRQERFKAKQASGPFFEYWGLVAALDLVGTILEREADDAS
jgi:hypothetical protein